MDWVLTGFC